MPDPDVQQGGPPDMGEQLVRQATALTAEGRLGDAASLFEQAAGLHRRARRRDDEVRCLTLLAQCRRLAGDAQAAAVAIGRARRLARPGTPAAIAAATEKAEVDVLHGDLEDAVLALDDAVRWHDARSTSPAGRDPEETAIAALLRRRATIQAGRGRSADVDRDFAAAAARLAAAGDEAAARRVLVERATALHSLGDQDAFARAFDRARQAAADAGDRAMAGELDLLEGAIAVEEGRLTDADALTRSAREHALAAVDPLLYVGASVALSELADAQADRVGAYEALAVGWATLGDLVGRESAASVFRPRMEALESRWGGEAFMVARHAYEDRRRRELKPEGAAAEPS